MTFLPVAERELRVAARKRSTFRVRVIAALVAWIIGSGVLVLSRVGPGFGTPSLGKGLFGVLTWLSLAVALSAGLFFTSDCLSEEKREGTLGFLFLTDLRGHDVVLGKLLATSLRVFYALLAVFPILAIALIMGGVTGAQFWKTSLALVNAMFVSVAVGLFVSAISRESQKALAATLFLLLLLVAAGPASDGIFAAIKQRAFNPLLSLSSPGYLFVTAGAWGRTPFWAALLANQAVAWTFFGLACLLLPRTWRENAPKRSTSAGTWAYYWKFGGVKTRRGLRRKLIEPNPVLWLACRERWQAVLLWALTILLVSGLAATFAADERWMLWFVWSYVAGACTLVLYLGIASQAGRFFVEAQRSGLIELLLATPLTSRQIVQGQWRALVRMFGAPLGLCLAAQLLGTFLVQQQTWRRVAATVPATTPPPIAATTNTVMTNATLVTTTITGTGTVSVSVGSAFTGPNDFGTLAISCATTLTVVANLAAVAWFGMWMGLNSKSANLATLKTILFVQIIPWFGVTFASALAVPLLLLPRLFRGTPTGPSQFMFWYPLLTVAVTTALYLIKDIAFSLWARRKLYSEFRERAAGVAAPIRPALPPPLPPMAVNAPTFKLIGSILLALAFAATAAEKNPMPKEGENPADHLPPWIKRVTWFGERADWSHDGKKLLFVEKTFGDVYEVELATGIIRAVTHHYPHIVYENGVPKLANLRVILESTELPFKCTMETQNFVPPNENKLTFSAYGYNGTDVCVVDLETRKVVDLTNSPDEYDEPEGIFPDGKFTLVECDKQNKKGASCVDLWKLRMDGGGYAERLTFFSDYPGYKSSNPVVSDDGLFVAFQMAKSRDPAGVGYGIFTYDLTMAKTHKR